MKKKSKKKVKRWKKKIIFFITLLLAILLPFLFIRINFFLGEPLHVQLSPKEVQLYLKNGEEESVSFSFSIKRFPLCTPYCQLRLKNYANGKEYSESLEFQKITGFQKNITFKAPDEGSGTNAYKYDIKCTIEENILCPSNNEEHIASTFITLNYELSEQNREYKNKSLEGLSVITREMGASYTNLDYLYGLWESFNKSFNSLPYYLSSIEAIENYTRELDQINATFNIAQLLVADEEYQKANPVIEKLKGKTINLSTTINITMNYLIEASREYNRIIEGLNSVSSNRLNQIFRFYRILANENQSIKYWVALSDSTKIINNIQIIEYNLDYSDNISNVSINNIIDIYDSLNERYIEDYPYVINSSEEIFFDYSKVLPENESIRYRDSIEEDKRPENICRIFNRTEELLGSTNYTTNLTAVNKTGNLSSSNETTSSTNISANNSMVFRFNISEFFMAKSIICNLSEPNKIIISQREHKTVNLNLTSLKYNFSIPKIEPKCCYDSVCKPCCLDCEDNESLFPILFLHGHSFSRGVSPEASLNSMVPLMEAMEKEGDINAGEVESGSEGADWSRFNKPIVARGSYYYISYLDLGINILQSQKSEGIENYALRLNEIINSLLQKTGKKKVNIVTHSMGGLVAREYIKIFGPEKIDRLVLIASPNHGIRGNPEKLCSFAGAAKECSDMEEGSIFLKRLNSYVPRGIKVYTITGVGCQMEGGIGDGVVLENSSRLDYAKDYTIQGNCTDIFSGLLHTDIIKPNRYPETVDILNKIFS